MIGLIQRVKSARIFVNTKSVASIHSGILLMIGFSREDRQEKIEHFVHKIISYRIFEDANGRMNESLLDINGELLVVPQFTLGASTKKGSRPSFSETMEPKQAKIFYDRFVEISQQKIETKSGVFGFHMEVESINNGPATFILVG